MTNARFIATKPKPAAVAGFSTDVETRVLALAPAAVLEVYGAPGSGKTSLLQARFEALVHKFGCRPERILVLAATRESAAALRDSLLLGLARQDGNFAVEGSLARTVSSLAFALVRKQALQNGQPAPELISGAEQDTIFAQLLAAHEDTEAADLWPEQVSKATRKLAGFRAELRDLLATCQELAVSAAELERIGVAQNRPEWRAASGLFAAYEQLMEGDKYHGRYDAPSLVNEAIELLRSGQAAAELDVILVDDSQELTPSAARLLLELVGAGSGLMLFGDPDASTLGFRQADPRASASLAASVNAKRGQQRAVFFIDERIAPADSHGGTIFSKVAGAMTKISGLIGAEGAGGQRKLYGTEAAAEAAEDAADTPAIQVAVLPGPQAEVEWLAYELRKQQLNLDLGWGEIAVVSRTRQQLEDLERNLSAQGVPARILGAQRALRDEFASGELLHLANFVASTATLDDPSQVGETANTCERLLLSPFCGLDTIGVRRLRRQLRRLELDAVEDFSLARNSDELLVELFANPAAAETLRGREGRKARAFVRSLQRARDLVASGEASIEDLLWQLWNGSGLEAEWVTLSRGQSDVATQAHRNLDAILALFAAANRYTERNPAGSIFEFLESQLGQAIPEDALTLNRRQEEFVTLTTPAGLVGRRFHTVVVPGLLEGVWPNLKPRGSLLQSNLLQATVTGRLSDAGAVVRTEMSDELRMFLKTLGAANERLIVSSFLHEDEQVSQFLNHLSSVAPVVTKTWDSIDATLTLRGLAGNLRRLAAVSKKNEEVAKAVADLGRLAQAGVAGAHPDDWYGLLNLSTTEPLFQFVAESSAGNAEATYDAGPLISVRPSQLEAFIKCPLHWFLNYHGAGGNDFAASVGTLVHQAMELADANDEQSLWRQVESGWHTLKFESAWIEQIERRRAQHLVANLSEYLTKFALGASTLIGREQSFEFNLGKAHIRGTVDRIEKQADGKLLIVDLKTSKRIPSVAEAQNHAQLGLYQLAYLNGAFNEVAEPGETSGIEGAKLVLVSGDKTAERAQPSLADNPELRSYFEGLVAVAAEGMAMPDNIFVANISTHCDVENEFGTCRMHLTQAVSYAE